MARKAPYESAAAGDDDHDDDYDEEYGEEAAGRKRKALQPPKSATPTKHPKFKAIHAWFDIMRKDETTGRKWAAVDETMSEDFKAAYRDEKSFQWLLKLDKDGMNRAAARDQMVDKVEARIRGVANDIIKKTKEEYTEGGYTWAVNRKTRNRVAHAKNGNLAHAGRPPPATPEDTPGPGALQFDFVFHEDTWGPKSVQGLIMPAMLMVSFPSVQLARSPRGPRVGATTAEQIGCLLATTCRGQRLISVEIAGKVEELLGMMTEWSVENRLDCPKGNVIRYSTGHGTGGNQTPWLLTPSSVKKVFANEQYKTWSPDTFHFMNTCNGANYVAKMTQKGAQYRGITDRNACWGMRLEAEGGDVTMVRLLESLGASVLVALGMHKGYVRWELVEGDNGYKVEDNVLVTNELLGCAVDPTNRLPAASFSETLAQIYSKIDWTEPGICGDLLHEVDCTNAIAGRLLEGMVSHVFTHMPLLWRSRWIADIGRAWGYDECDAEAFVAALRQKCTTPSSAEAQEAAYLWLSRRDPVLSIKVNERLSEFHDKLTVDLCAKAYWETIRGAARDAEDIVTRRKENRET